MKLSVVIPAHNEPELRATVQALTDRLLAEKTDHEVLIVNDHSTDDTENFAEHIERAAPNPAVLERREWINRKSGQSKWKIQEMGSRYLFIVLYCFIEKWLSRGDYHSSRIANGEKSVPRFSR